MIKTAMIWLWLCSTGYVVEIPHKHVGRKLYTFYLPNGKTAKYAYKLEILNYIKKKNWTYFKRSDYQNK